MNDDCGQVFRDKRDVEDNKTSSHDILLEEEYILDRTDIRLLLIMLYTIVFLSCFVGNTMVILVVGFSRRLRGVTNFFLGNLAIADLFVGLFCVYQTLLNYLMNSWRLGNFLCKVYMFVHAFSYTASILILMVVCVERYLATVYPIKCRSFLTKRRLRLIIAIVWIIAAIYAMPSFYYVETIEHHLFTGEVEVLCIPNMLKHNRDVLNGVNFFFLYLLPLVLMCCLYWRIAVGLFRSGLNFGEAGSSTSQSDSLNRIHRTGRNVIQERRGVIRMLVAVVLIFAICKLPQQIRIGWRYWGPKYDPSSNLSTLLTLFSVLISYANSCLNPILYAFFSRNFREGVRDLLDFRRTRRNRQNALALAHIGGEAATQQNNDEGNANNFRRRLLFYFGFNRNGGAADPPAAEQTV